jgi:hypothetical protein
MSRTRFFFTYIFLMALGLFGMWLGFRTRDASDLGTVLGALLVLGATVGLLFTFRHDLREPESEKRAEWERAKAKGRRHHVLSQIGFGVLCWVLMLLPSLLVDVYWGGGPWDAALLYLKMQAVLGVLVVAICGLWGLMWWSYQVRKYRGVN